MDSNLLYVFREALEFLSKSAAPDDRYLLSKSLSNGLAVSADVHSGRRNRFIFGCFENTDQSQPLKFGHCGVIRRADEESLTEMSTPRRIPHLS